MTVNVNSVHFKASDTLENYITTRLEKMTVLYDGIVGSEVSLKLDNTDSPVNKIAEVRLLINGNDLIAKKQAQTFEEASDQAIEALRRQLIKRKGKQNNKKLSKSLDVKFINE